MLSGKPCRAFSRFGLDNLNTPNRERFGVPTVWNVSILFYTQASSGEAVGPPLTLEGARPAPCFLKPGAVLFNTISDYCFELGLRNESTVRVDVCAQRRIGLVVANDLETAEAVNVELSEVVAVHDTLIQNAEGRVQDVQVLLELLR